MYVEEEKWARATWEVKKDLLRQEIQPVKLIGDLWEVAAMNASKVIPEVPEKRPRGVPSPFGARIYAEGQQIQQEYAKRAIKIDNIRNAYDKLQASGDILNEQFRNGTEGVKQYNQTIEDSGKTFEYLMESSSQWYDDEIRKQEEANKKQQEATAALTDAYRDMRGQMGKMTEDTYNAEVQTIDNLKTKYIELGAAKLTVDQWYYEQKKQLDIEMYKAGGGLLEGFLAGMMETQDSITTLGQIGSQTFTSLWGAFDTALDKSIANVDNFSDAFKNLGEISKEIFRQMLIDIMKASIKMAIMNTLFGGGGVGSGGGLLGLVGIKVPTAKQGGVAGQIPSTRLVNPAVFGGAPHFKNGGIVGLKANEVPIIAHKGETITPVGKTPSHPIVIINNNTGLPIRQTETRGEHDEHIITVVMDRLGRDTDLRDMVIATKG